MTVMLEEAQSAEQSAQRYAERLRDAMSDYMIGLSKLVDMGCLQARHEDPDFDFEVRVPSGQLYEITERLAQLSFEVSEQYSVRLATLAVPV